MYNKEYFYGITDLLHFNVYASLLKDYIEKEERVIIKVFKKDNEVVVIETNNFKDTILKDNRKDKTTDLMEYDLIYLKTLERYISSYELPNMTYEYIEGLGSWYKVKLNNFNPEDKLYKPFYNKKKLSKEDLNKYSNNNEELKKLNELYDIIKDIRFTNPKKVKELFESIEK